MRWQFLRFYIGLVLVLMMAAVGLFLYGQHEIKSKRIEWVTERGTMQLETIRKLLADFQGDEEARDRELMEISRAVMRPFPGRRPHRLDKGPRLPDREPRQKERAERPHDQKPPKPERGEFRGMEGGPPGIDRGFRPDNFPKPDPFPEIEKIANLALSKAEAKRLEEGETVTVDDDEELKIIIGLDSEEALMLTRPSPAGSEEEMRLIPHYLPILIPLCILICIGAVIFVLIRPIERRLSALTRVTKEFGEGQLNSRVKVGRTGSIDALEESFNAMASRIENLVNSQKDLLRAVSHDIRTPLSRIFFALEEAESAESIEDKNLHLKRIDKALLDLTEMINELLSILRLDESEIKPDKRKIDIRSLLDDPSELASDLGRDIVVESAVEAFEVYADPLYLKRAIDNLIANAIRHARTRMFISTCMRDGLFNFMVDDDGPGIPEEEREKVFQPFYRLDKSRSSDLGGTGLGLAIVARIMQWQHGKVRISDSPLGGARFTLLLPPQQD